MFTGKSFVAAVAFGVFVFALGGPARAGSKCDAGKLKVIGKKATCELGADAKAVLKGGTADFSKCMSQFSTAFGKLEAKAKGGCTVTSGDTTTIENKVDAFVTDAFDEVTGMTITAFPPARLRATGETTCWDSSGTVIPCAGTGQDGDTLKGVPLSYVDNGDGTVTDVDTGLQWEKQSSDGSVHDMGNTYTWDQAFSGHVATLNTMNFAGHNDWRLPNTRELESITNYQNFNPAVSPVFNTGCAPSCTVLICSCTTTSKFYWTSTTYAGGPAHAWSVNFQDGGVVSGQGTKSGIFAVRAVRGGP